MATQADIDKQLAARAADRDKRIGEIMAGHGTNAGSTTGVVGDLDSIGKEAGTEFNIGNAEYGGPGGVEFYKKEALKGMADNDAAQAGNNAAMKSALAAMKGAHSRGPQSVENKLLSSREAAARGTQGDAAGYAMAQAMGTAPSAAEFQTRGAMNDLMSARSGALGGARGLAGLAGSQMDTSASAGSGAGQAAMAGGNARSGEIAKGIQGYGQIAGQMAGQDLTRLGISDQNNQFNSKLNDEWAMGNANNAIGRAKLADAMRGTDQGWFKESMDPADIQFRLNQEGQGWEAGYETDKAGLAYAKDIAQRQQTAATVGGITQAGLTAVGSLAGPAGAAAGGLAGSAINSATRKYY